MVVARKTEDGKWCQILCFFQNAAIFEMLCEECIDFLQPLLEGVSKKRFVHLNEYTMTGHANVGVKELFEEGMSENKGFELF